MTKHVSSVFFAAALLVLMAGIPVSAAVVQNGTVCEQGATLFIGEEGLNVTHALNQANGSADPNGEPELTTIGWWASPADVSTTAPSRTIDISTRYKNLTVEPLDFVGYTGTWYLLAANGHPANMDAVVFTVQDPSLDIRIWDYDRATDVNGETIPLGTRLVFRIDTNLYGAADDTYRSPLNPATDGFINITVKNDTGFEFPALYNDSTSAGPVAGPYSLLYNYVNEQPYFWGSPATYSWKTNALDGGTNLYPAGSYTISAESALNHMRDNYQQGGADYTGKTVSAAYTVTLAEGILPAPVADFTADITSGEKPLTVTFTDTSTGTRTAWNWSFGDGDTTNATSQDPVHTYTAPGTYDVSLVVYNATSGSDSILKSRYVTVTSLIGQGDTLFIGDEGLNITHALNGAYYGGFCGEDVDDDDLNGIPPLTTIGWWASPADISTTAPSRTIDLATRYMSLTADPSSFAGYTGNWYLVGTNGRVYSPGMDGCGCTASGCIASLVFKVQDLSAPLPQAGVTITRDVLIEGFNNSLPGGIYNGTVMNFLALGHPADGSGLSFGNLQYSIRTHNLTWVESDEYAVWNETSATWNFPAWYLLPENSGQGVSVATTITVPQMMNVSLNRRFNQTRFDTTGYQFVGGNFSYASTEEILSTSLNIDMPFPDERVNATIVPGSFWTDAPVLSAFYFDTGTGMIAGLDPSALEQGRIYNFSAVYRIEPNGTALRFKPMVTVDVMVSQVFLNSSVPGYGLAIPPAMLPDNVTAASVSTDTMIGNWSLAQEHRIVTRLNQIVEPFVTANFTADVTSGPAPLTVTFMDTSTGSPAAWNWTFGDGSLVNATEQNPVHTYTAPGTYDVSLLATNTVGSNSTLKAGYITVTPSGGMAMVGVYRPTIQKFILKNGTERTVVAWGLGTDIPVSGDWNGDGMGDVGVYRPTIQKFILKNGTERTVVAWGLGTDTPVSGDWNGDGLGDVGVYRPTIQKFILKNGTERTVVAWGLGTDIPVSGDWNGDGMGDVGVYRPSIQKFILKNGTERTVVAWGLGTDIPVSGDWNGDGLGDVGVYRPSIQTFILKNGTERTVIPWGLATDIPVTGKWS